MICESSLPCLHFKIVQNNFFFSISSAIKQIFLFFFFQLFSSEIMYHRDDVKKIYANYAGPGTHTWLIQYSLTVIARVTQIAYNILYFLAQFSHAYICARYKYRRIFIFSLSSGSNVCKVVTKKIYCITRINFQLIQTKRLTRLKYLQDHNDWAFKEYIWDRVKMRNRQRSNQRQTFSYNIVIYTIETEKLAQTSERPKKKKTPSSIPVFSENFSTTSYLNTISTQARSNVTLKRRIYNDNV